MTASNRKVWSAAELETTVLDLQGLPVDPRGPSDSGHDKRNGSIDYPSAGGEGVSLLPLR